MVTPTISDLLTFAPSGATLSETASSDARALMAENKALRARICELERAVDTDPLLPLYNRRAFVREIDRARNVMARYDILSSVIYFDLDNFKSINDRYGHAIGDDILKAVSNVLSSGVRDCDLVARLGGDEFGVLLFKTDAVIAKAKASALACRISELAITMPTGRITTGASWGIAACEADDTADQILSRADRAMYIAKRSKAA